MTNNENKQINKKKRKRNRLIFRSSILVVLSGALLFAIVSNLNSDTAIVKVGDEAPDFQLKRVANNEENKTMKLSELEGKGVMLNFWGTWCEPCKREMPFMEELYPKYKEQGVEIVAVSLDNTELVIENFVNQYNLTFPILHDKDSQVLDRYGIKPLPTTYFIDENGVVVDRVLGGLTLERLEGYLKQIVPS